MSSGSSPSSSEQEQALVSEHVEERVEAGCSQEEAAPAPNEDSLESEHIPVAIEEDSEQKSIEVEAPQDIDGEGEEQAKQLAEPDSPVSLCVEDECLECSENIPEILPKDDVEACGDSAISPDCDDAPIDDVTPCASEPDAVVEPQSPLRPARISVEAGVHMAVEGRIVPSSPEGRRISPKASGSQNGSARQDVRRSPCSQRTPSKAYPPGEQAPLPDRRRDNDPLYDSLSPDHIAAARSSYRAATVHHASRALRNSPTRMSEPPKLILPQHQLSRSGVRRPDVTSFYYKD